MPRFFRLCLPLLAGVLPLPALAVDTGSQLSVSEAQILLAEHARVRAEVRVAPLQWSAQLASEAQAWANQLTGRCELDHSNTRRGENLFMGTAGYYGMRDAIAVWESERAQYQGGVLTPGNWVPSGHYTQMVWRDTRFLGCGKAVCKGELILVCNYDPAGNRVGQRPY